jgi:RNA polymerase sigma-70 factor (ECF subfamily)
MPIPRAHAIEARLLSAAQHGDSRAFDALVAPHRADIHRLSYRMLGSPYDADDAVQEALLRAWRALPRFDGRSALRTWLYRIAMNVCLDAIARRPRRLLPSDHGDRGPPGLDASTEPLDPSLCVEPYPDAPLEDDLAGPEARYEQREALELTFVAALQHLPPRQRAVFVLRDVLSFSPDEIAKMLATTRAAVNSALQRAREMIEARLPDRSQQETMRALGQPRLRELVGEVIDAFERGELEAILAHLADDAVFSMPPYAAWYRGRDQLSESWLFPDERPTGLRFVPTRANGQVALGVYKRDPETNRYRPIALEVLALRGELIAEVTSFREPALVRAFGLPEELAA